jgi:hypothetical protein
MKFLQPSLLNFLWLALIPLGLWLFRRKAKRVPVSTLLFFRTLAREHQESAWLRRLKRLLSLLLTLTVIVLGALALSRPYREGGAGDTPRSLVIVLDHSASMAATDDKGRSRLDEAKSLLRDRLKAMPENVITSLVIYDSKAEVAQSRSTNRREMLRLLDETRVTPTEDQPAAALVVARRLAALDAPAEIVFVSDREFPREASENAKSIQFINMALDHALNVGITAFQIRPAPLVRNRFDAFVEVSASSANKAPVEATIEARLDGRPVQLRQVELKPGGSTRLTMPLEGGKGQRLEMEVRVPGDCLAWDNVVLAPLPETKPLVVAWIADSPDPFTELALTSMLAEDRIQVLKGGVKDWPLKEKPDVYVFENWLPPVWPSDLPALILNPPSSIGPIRAQRMDKPVPFDAIRAVQPDHPLLFRVTSTRVAVTQTTSLKQSDTLETLWMAGQEPMLAAGEANGQRIVVTAFQPGKSEQLALLSAFPLLIGNAIYWCAENNVALASLKPRRVGEVVPVEPGIVKWRAWDGRGFIDASDESKNGWLELRRIGTFEQAGGKTESALLLSPRETDIATADNAKTTASMTKPRQQWAGSSGWWSTLLWLLLVVLLLESWLFHRQTVY